MGGCFGKVKLKSFIHTSSQTPAGGSERCAGKAKCLSDSCKTNTRKHNGLTPITHTFRLWILLGFLKMQCVEFVASSGTHLVEMEYKIHQYVLISIFSHEKKKFGDWVTLE